MTNEIAPKTPPKGATEKEGKNQRITHNMILDISDKDVTEAVIVNLAAQMKLACGDIPAADRIEFFIKLPNGNHTGGGFDGGEKGAHEVASFARSWLAKFGHHFGNNLGDKVQAHAEALSQSRAKAESEYAASKAQETVLDEVPPVEDHSEQ